MSSLVSQHSNGFADDVCNGSIDDDDDDTVIENLKMYARV